MRLGRYKDGGRPVVAYDSTEEAVERGACLTCNRFPDRDICKRYRVCRAGKKDSAMPLFYIMARREVIESRMTTVEGAIEWI